MAELKVVALISGGKDSLFSILHCIANGHDVVALANLHPPLRAEGDAVEDMDSFMYQTVGHAVIPLYEQALGLPLYRQEILGSAVDQSKSYGQTQLQPSADEDETESLVPLLLRVKEAHPEINAVSTGAILSDYQRTRIESVAIRLGLTPLSFLWQWPHLPPQTQSSLLDDMGAVGQDSRIIKVASGGLDGSLLWQNVAERRTIARLTKASERFGSPGDGAVLGEGGEYETLAISGPTPLWKGKIVVEGEQRQVMNGEAGSFSMRLSAPRVDRVSNVQGSMDQLRIPPILDQDMERILDGVLSGAPVVTTSVLSPPSDSIQRGLTPPSNQITVCQTVGSDHDVLFHSHRTGLGPDAASQMRSIMDTLLNELGELVPGVGTSAITYTSIVLRDMNDFATINAVYGSYFTEPNPPARVTLACADALPPESFIMLGVTSLPQPLAALAEARKGLHVQSRSYWAPANIGPYSQAVSVSTQEADAGNVVYVAGQIPLQPASMELYHGQTDNLRSNFAHQTVLALQHMLRVGDAMKVKRWIAAIAFVVVPPSDDAAALGKMAQQAWEALHTLPPNTEDLSDEVEDDDFDIWHVRHGLNQAKRQQSGIRKPGDRGQLTALPPLWVIIVDSLPKGASIEWVGYGTTSDDHSEVEVRHLDYLLNIFHHRII